MDVWKTCPDYHEFECRFDGEVRRMDGKEFILYLINRPGSSRKYRSLTPHWLGCIYRQVFRAFGPPNPDPARYTLIDHTDNNSLNDHVSNLRWSNKALNALNTSGRYRGWSFDNSGNRKNNYKASVKWLGKGFTLGRYATAEEATEKYRECKDWVQKAYREHKYVDRHLVVVWRLFQQLKAYEVGADPAVADRQSKQFERSMTQLARYLSIN